MVQVVINFKRNSNIFHAEQWEFSDIWILAIFVKYMYTEYWSGLEPLGFLREKKNSHYFFNLEKRNFDKKHIQILRKGEINYWAMWYNVHETCFDHSIWICKVSWCHCLSIIHSFCPQKLQKFPYFSYERSKLALYPPWINAK